MNVCRSFFFFQAEDGIRDYKVTGVQTCALPIWSRAVRFEKAASCARKWDGPRPSFCSAAITQRCFAFLIFGTHRSAFCTSDFIRGKAPGKERNWMPPGTARGLRPQRAGRLNVREHIGI